MITRRIGKLLRGKATPFQVLAAGLLGAWVAFVPAVGEAPGLLLFWLFFLVVLNANLGVAVLVFLPAKLCSLVLMPVSFGIGRFLLDGPTAPLLRGLVNAPVLAWFGLENYAATGGLVTGLAVGLAAGGFLVWVLQGFRRKLTSLEHDSERYRKYVSKPWVKVLVFVFVGGGHGKKTYAELAERRVGLPVRIVGLVLVVGVVVLLSVAARWLQTPILTRAVRGGLEQANGATVELGAVELDLSEGRLTIRDLALADPNALDTDLLRAELVEADLSGFSLLKKRLAIDRLVLSNAVSGAPRATPGVHVGPPPEATGEAPAGEGKTLEDYLRDAERWKERLTQARSWIERLSRVRDVKDAVPDPMALEERVRRAVEADGWARVDSEQAVTAAPTLLVRELVVEGLTASWLQGEVLDVRANDLSTHPHLVERGPRIDVRSRSERLALELGLDQVATDPGASRLFFSLRDLPVDAVADRIVSSGEPPIRGGEMDLVLDGSWAAGEVGRLDLPLRVELRNTVLAIPGRSAQIVERFALPISLRGPLDAPRVRIDDEELVSSLLEAGATQLADEARKRAEGVLDEVGEDLQEKLGEELGDELEEKAGGLLDKLRKKD